MSNIGHNSPPLDPKETIQRNIERKKPILDRDPQYYNNIPIPSWIELSLIDVCNRACNFCPKSDETIAPNTYQKMNLTLIDKLITSVAESNGSSICTPLYILTKGYKDVLVPLPSACLNFTGNSNINRYQNRYLYGQLL